MQDIAKLAGVSISTVSRVIRSDSSVEEANRTKVESAIQQTGYKLKKSSKNDSEQMLVSLIVPNIANPFYGSIVKGIQRVARIHEYSVVVYDSEEDIEREKANLALATRGKFQGLIYVSCMMQTNSIVEELLKKQYPIVFLDRISDEIKANVVFSDNVEGAYQAVTYLLKLGHERIVYVAGTETTSTERDRFKGYRLALEEEGLPFDRQLIVKGEYDLDKAYEGMKKLIQDKVEFSAVFSSNDLMAFGIKQALEENNIRVPDDVSIVGYDDIILAQTISLTVVSQPIVEMGQSAMNLLLDLIDNRVTSPQKIVHRPSLIIRKSCKRR
jgi:LacI family transcriptional regulator